jgi:hypothetical protein
MPVRAYLPDNAAFNPEAIQAMSTAFELACADLEIFAGDQHGREVIAMRIIDLARRGILDAGALHRRVVSEARLSG